MEPQVYVVTENGQVVDVQLAQTLDIGLDLSLMNTQDNVNISTIVASGEVTK